MKKPTASPAGGIARIFGLLFKVTVRKNLRLIVRKKSGVKPVT
jgi:hypothetical protein